MLTAALLVGWPAEVSAGSRWSACWQAFWSRSSDEEPDKKSARLAAVAVAAASATAGDAPRDGRMARCLREWSHGRRQPEYGLVHCPSADGCRLANQPRSARPLVVFLHGMNSRPEDLNTLVDRAIAAGYRCATFRYPNDQRISRSARQLAEALNQLRHEQTELTVSLVTHSMGGLVAREAIENRQLRVTNVRRLIMIAPPNHGSELARYACSLDVWEYASSRSRRREAGLVTGSICDGLAEAVDDLRPGSAFLKRLNARPRNPHVRYSVFVGTEGPLAEDRCSTTQRCLQALGRWCGWDAASEGRICVRPADELLAGKGDGCVAVRRARLSGVKDFVVAEFSHREVLDDADDPVVRRIHAAILKRLAKGDSVVRSGVLSGEKEKLSQAGLECDPRHCHDSIASGNTG